MCKYTLIALALFLFHSTLFGQIDDDFYITHWSEVHKNELKELPKSALVIVDSIYAQAREEQNYVQLIKAMIFQAKFATKIVENHELYIVDHFKDQISNSVSPLRNVLESTLAQIYWQYYQNHRWGFYQRSRTENKVNPEDFRTWDLRTLFEEIHYHYQESVNNPEILQHIPLGEIDELLELYEGSKQYRPTLYDFLAHNALNFYQSSESRLTEVSNKFEIRDEQYFKYSNHHEILIPDDSLSLDYQSILMYHELLKFHKSRKDTSAFIMTELDRLEFLKDHGIFSDPDRLYINALQTLKADFRDHPASTLIDYQLANSWFEKGANYNPGYNKEHQYAKRKALEICEVALLRFPESHGAKKCRQLKSRIIHPSLSIIAEGYIPINTHSRLLVRYTNIEELNFYVLKVSETQRRQYQELRTDSSRLALMTLFEEADSWECILPGVDDYQEHTTETILPPLAGGNYMVAARLPKQKEIFGYAFIQVTDLVLVETSMDNQSRFQVLYRKNGSPVKDAVIQLKNNVKQANRKHYDRAYVTDKNGFSTVAKNDEHYGNLQALVTSDSDTARFGNYYLSRTIVKKKDRNNDKPIYAKPFVFMDRSIYRPGQTVYFKGILTKKQADEISVVSGEYVEVYLYDPNDEEISFLRLKTNEFGSFSGEFKLPTSGLTGEYSISAEEDYEEDSKFYDEDIFDFEWNELYFSVEEYKRPRFEVAFDPVKDAFRLMDSVSISGKAAAFTGAYISNAKVTYKVTRTVRYPSWYYWSNPGRWQSSEAREITYGETATDPDGSFNISFMAIPDELVAKEELPVFEYRITADITDINGETRSAEATIKVGYHTMNITINTPAVINKNNSNDFLTIDAQNLNGQKTDARGSLKLYQVKTPSRVLRDRPWPAPDFQEIPEDKFVKLFPHDPYKGESNSQKQEKGKLVFSTEFDTEKEDSIKLPVDDRWEAGNYIVEIESKDVYDQPVLSKSKFKLKGDNSSSVTNNLIVFHSLDKSKYTAGDKVNFTIGSASDDVTVTVDIEKDHKVISTQLIHLSNNTHTFSIPVKKSDTQGFAIHFHLVNYNGFKAGTQIINVYEPKEELHIETATFRDKLQPGAKETWSFTINGSKKARAETEVLASMYDASLDQFKSHNWSFDPKIKSRYYTNNQSRAYNSFRTENFRIRNLPYPSFYIREQQFDRQDWFGFSLDNNKYVQQQYLQRLSVIYYDTIRQESKITISNDNKRQDGFVYGRIVDLQGALLPGVNVIVKGTKRGTVTDMNGEYAIRVGKGEALEFSYIGYVNTGVEVGKENIIDVQLSEDITRLEEIVVVGYGVRKKASLTGSVVTIADEETVIEEIVFEEAPEEELAGRMAGVSVTNAAGDAYKLLIRGVSSVNDNSNPLYVVDGKVIMDASQISEDDLASISVLKGSNATALYGARAANGVILITTKSGQKKLDEELAKVRARKNLKETAFFYPHLKTDKKGNISFSFDTPEALTRWKLQLLAHTKNVTSATKTLQAVTAKDLMIIPNAPRFLRQGDELVISAKVTNLTSNTMGGMIGLQLSDPFTGEDVNEEFDNLNRNKSFKVNSQGNTEVSWRLSIPENKDIVQYRIVAKANDFSDGEQNVLPILSNRMLITETLPMQVRTGESKTFSLEKLNNNNSSTLRHHLLTLEVTSNPTWYALQALPYLMEFPHECAEQTFARYYANALAKHIIDKNDDIKNVFESWSAKGEIRSNLESNEDLKSIMIQETPWLRDAQSEKAQKERISTLFDESYLKESLDASIYKLELMQLSNGGFPWFSGSHLPNRYITQHIMLGLAHLQHLNVDFENFKANYILKNGLKYLDNQILMDYNDLLSRAEEYYSTIESKEEYLKKNHLRPIHIQYLYMHSYFHDSIISEKSKPAYDYFKNQSMVYWQDFNPYMKGMIALIQHRAENLKMAKDIIHSLKENSITNEELGMYWKKNAESWHWFYAPIETQSLLIEAISEIEANDTTQTEQEKVRTIDYLKIWLLKNKQTNRWPTTKSTTEAIYALLLEGSDWLSVTEQVEVSIGNQKIEPENQPEVATGYYKAAWASEEIGPSKSNVTMTKKDQGIAWGSLYWQYFEDLDKITPAETPLKLSKAIFNVINTSSGQVLQAVDDTTRLQVGDLIRVRIELSADRPMEYLHMKDMRAAGMEPVNVLSEYKWQDGLGYYESTRDASTNFFFDHLPKGVYIFEYDLRVNNSGHFSNGITTIQSMYAPEYSSHSEGVKVIVE